MLQDLIVAAINDAHRKVDDELKQPIGGMMSGLNARALSRQPLPNASSLDRPAARLIASASHRPVQAPARHRRQERAAPRVPLLRTPREDAERLCDAIRQVKDRVTYCSICNNITDVDPCGICADEARDRRMICVVEEPQNVNVIEKTGGYRGVYHVLIGAISPL